MSSGLITLNFRLNSTARKMSFQVWFSRKKEAARVMFKKINDSWIPLVDPQEVAQVDVGSIKWVVAFDGKKLGSVQILDSNPSAIFINEWFYTRDKIYEVSSKQDIPSVKDITHTFSGWCDEPELRPLILLSQQNYEDPEKWKPFKPMESYKQRLYRTVRRIVGSINAYRCVDIPNEDKMKIVPYEFTADDLVIHKGYRSASGKELISIGLDLKKINCDGPPVPQWINDWFLLSDDKIDYLGSEMELVDAGDYDKDGKSEFIFWYSGYDKDGYILMYNDFKQKVEYMWSYH